MSSGEYLRLRHSSCLYLPWEVAVYLDISRVENWDDNLIIAIGLLENEAQLFALIHVEIQETLTYAMLFVLSMMYALLSCEQDKIN